MTTFLLVRHAQHEFGDGRLAGRTPDVHLSPKGLVQAEALATRLGKLKIDALYASPILRCQETASLIGVEHGVEVRTAEAVTELDFGDWQGEKIESLDERELWRRFNAFRGGTRAPHGELFLEVQLRVVRFLLELKERHEGETVAVVAHADPIRAALLHFLGVPMDLFLRLEISPASVSTVILEDYAPRVLGINHTGDLPAVGWFDSKPPPSADTLLKGRSTRPMDSRKAGSPTTIMPQGSEKRVGVLTFHRCINYGSYWQARSLVEGLRARGHDAVLLDYASPVAETRVALRPTIPTPVPREDVRTYKQKVRKFEAAFARLPLSMPFCLAHPGGMEPMDTVVLGSDEVWNLRHPWFAGFPAFWGQGLNARRVVSYAASFGNYSCWEGIGVPCTDWLEGLDAISVRDENSWWMLKNALGRVVDTVLDPTLQFPLAPEREWRGPEGRFALVYGHNMTSAFARSVRAWADRRGLPLLSLGYRNDWADLQWLDAGPHDFAHAMVRAEAVATNFFHGCAFALREGKPFACETSPYRSIKVRGLMELLGGLDRLVPNGEIDDRMDAPADFVSRLAELRAKSDAYLDRALDGTPVRASAGSLL